MECGGRSPGRKRGGDLKLAFLGTEGALGKCLQFPVSFRSFVDPAGRNALKRRLWKHTLGPEFLRSCAALTVSPQGTVLGVRFIGI